MAEIQRERDRERLIYQSSMCYFTPQMSAMARTGPSRSQKPEGSLGLPRGYRCQILGQSSAAFPNILVGNGSEVEQLGLQPGPIRDAWYHRYHSMCQYTTMLDPGYFLLTFIFSLFLRFIYLFELSGRDCDFLFTVQMSHAKARSWEFHLGSPLG